MLRVSHAHEDHVGGFVRCVVGNKSGQLYAPKTEANTKAYKI